MDENIVERAWNILRSGGVRELIIRSFNFFHLKTTRPLLPTIGYITKNGVKYRPRKPFDKVGPWMSVSNDPKYESALISALREHVQTNDRVGIIGGGRGISTVIAAKQTGPGGKVEVYEASSDRIDIIKKVVNRNSVGKITIIHHALVGPNITVYGELGDAKKILPSDLPKFDILEMDCEGAELEILENLEINPNIIIVEVHPPEVLESEVVQELNKRDYNIIEKRWETENIPVLTAKHNG